MLLKITLLKVHNTQFLHETQNFGKYTRSMMFCNKLKLAVKSI